MSDQPDQVTYSMHMPLPSDETAAQALWAHLQDFTALAAAAGWSADVVVTMTGPKDADDD